MPSTTKLLHAFVSDSIPIISAVGHETDHPCLTPSQTSGQDADCGNRTGFAKITSDFADGNRSIRQNLCNQVASKIEKNATFLKSVRRTTRSVRVPYCRT